MKLEVKDIPVKLLAILQKLKRYRVMIFAAILIGLYGLMIMQIGRLAVAEPTEDAVSENLKTVKRPKIDQKAIAKIQELQDNSVTVQALFKQARDNPFEN